MSDQRKGLPSASAWRRLELCAASWQLEQEALKIGQSTDRPTRWSASGNRIHAYLYGEPDEEGKEVVLNESEQRTADLLQERAQEQLTRIFQGRKYEVLKEKRLWMSIDRQPALSGQFDLCAWAGRIALVQDFKTGFAEPDPAEQNSQLKVLAVLVAMHLDVDEVVVQLISGPFGVTEARYGLAELSAAYEEIVKTWKSIHDPYAAFSPSPEACKYCPAILICQAVKSMAQPLARLQLGELPIEPDRVGAVLDEIAVLRRHFDAIEEFYYDRLTADPSAAITGYALVPGAPRREITDIAAARQRLSEWLDPADLDNVSALKIGDLEKLYGKKAGLKGAAVREEFNRLLSDLISEKVPAPSLKRIKKAATAELSPNQ